MKTEIRSALAVRAPSGKTYLQMTKFQLYVLMHVSSTSFLSISHVLSIFLEINGGRYIWMHIF